MARDTDKTAANTRGLNVDPISSVLPIITRDVDASGLAQTALDGEFLIYSGRGKAPAATCSGAEDFNDLASLGGNARMVWGHANRADRTGSGKNRTPVLMSKAIIKLSLYNYKAATAITPGDLVLLHSNHEAVGGSSANTRYIADIQPKGTGPVITAGGDNAWVVGVVLEGVASGDLVDAATGNAAPVTIELYENPYLLTGA